MEGEVWFAVAVGVANQPQPGSMVRGSEVGSSKHSPCRIEPAFGQVSKNFSESPSPSKETFDVLHDDVAGSYFTNDPGVLGPHPFCDVPASSGLTDNRTWESSADEVDRLETEVASALTVLRSAWPAGSVNISDVLVSLRVGKVALEDSSAEGVDFDLPCGSHPGSLKAEVKASDSCEE